VRLRNLQKGRGLTADDIATKLRLTRSAVRAQIAAMERDGVADGRKKTRGPHPHVFELTLKVEKLVSKALDPDVDALGGCLCGVATNPAG
jgi:predicted ArsR family transcriptional regulator